MAIDNHSHIGFSLVLPDETAISACTICWRPLLTTRSLECHSTWQVFSDSLVLLEGLPLSLWRLHGVLGS